LVVAAAHALPGLRSLVDLAVVHVPGGGLIRDAQKFVAPLALVEGVACGVGVERLVPALPPRWGRAAAAGLVAAPVLLLPALAWGAARRRAPGAHPRRVAHASAVVAAGAWGPAGPPLAPLPRLPLERRAGGAGPGPALVPPAGDRQRRPGAGRRDR